MPKDVSTTQISDKIHGVISLVHRAFMQPKKEAPGKSLRKQYWAEAWSEVKNLSASELEELKGGIGTVCDTLYKLIDKIEELRNSKVKEMAESYSLSDLNRWRDEEFLDSSASLPVFNPKSKDEGGKRWVITKPIERPRTTLETCQAIWVIITNRAIYIVDKGKSDVAPSAARDVLLEKHRLATIPALLDDRTVTDPQSGKPLMNIYMISQEVKETLLWLLAQRAKTEKGFAKLYAKFLKKEVLEKEKTFEWAKRYTPLAKKILVEMGTK